METLQEEVDRLRKEVKALQKKAEKEESDRVEAAAKEQARFFLVTFFIPFFERVCEAKEIRLEQAVSDLIEENKTLDEIFEENIEKTSSLMESPQLRAILITVRPVVDKSDKWIEKHSPIILEVMEDIRPELAQVVYEADNGRKWFADSLKGIRKMLINIS